MARKNDDVAPSTITAHSFHRIARDRDGSWLAWASSSHLRSKLDREGTARTTLQWPACSVPSSGSLPPPELAGHLAWPRNFVQLSVGQQNLGRCRRRKPGNISRHLSPRVIGRDIRRKVGGHSGGEADFFHAQVCHTARELSQNPDHR